jgi:MFS family permease
VAQEAHEFAGGGLRTLPVMLGTVTAALVVAVLVGRALGILGTLRTVVGVGTGICGAAAIAAVSGVIEASEVDIAYAMSTIFVFNLIAVLLFPPIGHLLGLSQGGFGLWPGTAVNDTSSVVATGYAFGHAAGIQSVIVKLTRRTMIIPVVAVLGVLARRGVRQRGAGPGRVARSAGQPRRRLDHHCAGRNRPQYAPGGDASGRLPALDARHADVDDRGDHRPCTPVRPRKLVTHGAAATRYRPLGGA